MGASPSASSSISSRRGRVSITRASASICCSPPERVPAAWWSRGASSGNRSSASSIAERACAASPAERVGADQQVVADGQPGEGHLAADQQRGPLADDLLRLEIGAVDPEDADDAAVRVVETGHRPQQGRLAGTVGAEQRDHLPFADLEIHVEEHLVGAVEEVEIVDLQRRHRPAGLPAAAFGVALEDVLDHQGDVPLHVARSDHQHETADRAHRTDEGEGDGRSVEVADGVAHRTEQHAAGEPAEDQREDAEHREADGAHLGGCGRREGQEDADGEWRHRGVGEELEGDHQPQVRHVERGDEQPAVAVMQMPAITSGRSGARRKNRSPTT